MTALGWADRLEESAPGCISLMLPVGDARELASLLREGARDMAALRKAVEDAPHGRNCDEGIGGAPCNCWKSRLKEHPNG